MPPSTLHHPNFRLHATHTSAHAHIGQATVEHFVSRVFDIARPFQSFVTSVRPQFSSLSELWPTHPLCTLRRCRLSRSARTR